MLADWIDVETLNMFNIGSRSTVIKSVVQSVNSGLESANYIADSKANSVKLGMWVQAFNVAWIDYSSCIVVTVCFHVLLPFKLS